MASHRSISAQPEPRIQYKRVYCLAIRVTLDLVAGDCDYRRIIFYTNTPTQKLQMTAIFLEIFPGLLCYRQLKNMLLTKNTGDYN